MNAGSVDGSSRVALVTGGGGGIGSAICHALAAAGHEVVVGDLRREDAERVAREVDGRAAAIDVTDPASVTRSIDDAGRVDICVNCAGWERATPFLECDEAFMERVVAINLMGTIRVTQAVLGGMVARGWGRIVNVSSDAGLVGSPLSVVYSAAKGGVISFTKAIAKDVGRRGVTANVVSPGAIDTPLLRASMGANLDRVLRAVERTVPVGRVGTPEEVAVVAAFLASPEASYVTGQTVSAGGGQAMP
jgi:2-hydroxycyclohexanecarboxyl-CoA dehydrogenase